MIESTAKAPTSTTEAMAEALSDLHGQAVLLVVPALIVAAGLLAAMAEASTSTVEVYTIAAGLSALALTVWTLSRITYGGAVAASVLGTTLAVVVLVTYAKTVSALPLLALPIGLTVLLVNVRVGGLFALAASILLIFPPAIVPPVDLSLRILTILQLWGTLALTSVVERKLFTLAEWAWSHYERNRELLDEARDYQLEAKQTLKDLAAACQQLAELNQYVGRLRQEAEDARRAKEQFVANVSHELRTPLNMIIGFTELITTSPRNYGARIPTKLLADLEIILRNSRHLADLINDVLDLSQIEANRMALTKERVDIDEILDAAATAVRGLFEAKQLDFKIERAADLPPVLCDRTRVRQVLLNLLSNAARFTESGGVCLRARQERDDIVLAVTDTGPGVAQSDIDRLFQPFEQLDGSIRRKHEGSGLGLSISRRFVEMHGGTMWMESEPGHGCTVAFRLPVDGPLPPATTYQRWLSEEWEFHERTRPSLATPPVVKPRLIVVNAGSALQNLLRRYLDNAELVLVADLDAAISEAARRPAELLLVNADSVSQELDRLILGGMLPPGLPTILCTMPSDSAAIAALGATDYLVKPIAQERLLAMMAHLNITDQAILVVDDEPEAVLLYMRMLTGAGRGYRVLSAANGTEALKLIRSHRPAVVLLDLVMPEMDGFRVLAECRADPALRDLPIIVISAKDAQGQPVVSGSMAITLAGGITTQHLLATIEAMRAILLPGHRPTNHALATGAATPPPLPEASITAAGDPARGSAHPGNRPG